MPTRKEVLKKISIAAQAQGLTWAFTREGGNHSVYKLDGLMIPIHRHKVLDRSLAEMVYRECEAKLGKGWWR